MFDLFKSRLPSDLTGISVLDLGSNACGLSIEFAKRGASVVAVELGAVYKQQAELVLRELQLRDRVELLTQDIFRLVHLKRKFDVVCYVGLSYHLRYPQLALDMLTRYCDGYLLASTQTIAGDALVMANRARHIQSRELGQLHGYEPTEQLFIDMLSLAGFTSPELVSTSPHAGEMPGRICGNRSYFFASAAEHPHSLPFVDDVFIGKPERSR